jgi:hypothetical protein
MSAASADGHAGYVRSAAVAYARRGRRVVIDHAPLRGGGCTCGRSGCGDAGKHPRGVEWQKRASADPDLIGRRFAADPDSNVGWLLGDGLADIDFDAVEAAAAADVLMPTTPAVSGRPSAPLTHRFYLCPGLTATE